MGKGKKERKRRITGGRTEGEESRKTRKKGKKTRRRKNTEQEKDV